MGVWRAFGKHLRLAGEGAVGQFGGLNRLILAVAVQSGVGRIRRVPV